MKVDATADEQVTLAAPDIAEGVQGDTKRCAWARACGRHFGCAEAEVGAETVWVRHADGREVRYFLDSVAKALILAHDDFGLSFVEGQTFTLKAPRGSRRLTAAPPRAKRKRKTPSPTPRASSRRVGQRFAFLPGAPLQTPASVTP